MAAFKAAVAASLSLATTASRMRLMYVLSVDETCLLRAFLLAFCLIRLIADL